MSKSNITPDGLVWSSYFIYDPSTDSCLRWVDTEKFGQPISSKNGEHFRVYIPKYGPFYCHRIIYEMFNGAITNGSVVDHIDGNPLNNTIENLRAVSQKINARNQTNRINNTSGTKGVQIRKNGEVVATWKHLSGKCGYKSYSISKYGFEEAFKLASEYRAARMNELNKHGAGYSARHIKDLI